MGQGHEPQREEERQHFLAVVDEVLAASLEYETTMRRVADVAVPRFADWCTVHLPAEGGTIRAAAVAHADPDLRARLADLAARHPLAADGPHPVATAICTGLPVFIPRVTEADLRRFSTGSASAAEVAAIGCASMIVVPLLARERAFGALRFVRSDPDRPYDEADLTLAEDLARRVALAIDNARLYAAEQDARRVAERAAERMARLQAVTAALSRALTSREVAEVVVAQGMAAFGARSCSVARLAPDGATLEALAIAGYAPDLAARFRRYPLARATPMSLAVRSGHPNWIEGLDAIPPDFPGLRMVAAESGDRAWATMPLLVDEAAIGGIGLSFAEERPFSPEERTFLLTLAQQCAGALERARLFEAERDARQAAERAADRTARLQAVTAALSGALTPAEVARVVVDQSIAALAARAGSLVLVAVGEAGLDIIYSAGHAATTDEEYRRLARAGQTPLREVIRTGEPLWAALTAATAHYPDFAATWRAAGYRSWTVLPLLREGTVAGALTLTFADERVIDPTDRAFLLSLAGQATAALDRARLFEAERQARAVAEDTQARQALLADISAVLVAAREPLETLEPIARLTVPLLADFCIIDLVEETAEGIEMRRAAIAHRDPEAEAALRALRERSQLGTTWERHPLARVLQTGEPVFRPEIDDDFLRAAAADEAHARAMLALGFRSYLIVPLQARGRLFGALTFMMTDHSGRRFAEPDLMLAVLTARRIGLALDNARLYAAEQDARRAAERAAEQTARLQAVTAALSEALTPAEVAWVVVEQGVAALGGAGGLVSLVAGDGEALELLASSGYTEAMQALFRRLPLAIPMPSTEAVRTATPIWLESTAIFVARYPHLAEQIARNGTGALAALPLVIEGRTIGCLTMRFGAPRAFDPDDRAFALTLAQQCAGALERARLYEAERQARQRLTFLGEVGAALNSSLDYRATLDRLAGLVVPTLADWCAIDVLEPDGTIRRIGAAHDDPAKEALLLELRRRYPLTLETPHAITTVICTGQAQLIPDFSDAILVETAQNDEQLAMLRALGFRSNIIAPLMARDYVLGALSLTLIGAGRRYDEADLALAEELARRAAVAIDNARLYRDAQWAETHYRSLFAGVGDAVLVIDAEGRYVDANAAAVELYGYSRHELLRMRSGDLDAAGAADSWEQFRQRMRAGVWRGESEALRKDGTSIPVEGHVTLVEAPEGPVYVSAVRDISERRAVARLQHEFIAMVTHDLRNPLTAIKGYAQMLQLRAAYSAAAVGGILKATGRMERLVGDLLDAAQLEAGRLQLRPTSVDLVALVRSAADEAQRQSDLHTVEVELPDGPLIGQWDQVRISQALTNLLSNAIKYSPEGGEVRVRVAPRDGEVLVAIEDHGLGIAPEAQTKLFRRFSRSESAAASGVQGLGLGLYISKSLIEAHGGQIWLESAVDVGSTFSFVLPLAPAVVDPDL